MHLEVGDLAVYAGHGVVKVKRIENKKLVNGKNRDFYILQAIDNQMTIVIPIDSIDEYKLRPITPIDKANNILCYLATHKFKPVQTTWNVRYRDYIEQLATGDIHKIAEVYGNLLELRKIKDLSFGERKMIERAKELLNSELGIHGLQVKEEA